MKLRHERINTNIAIINHIQSNVTPFANSLVVFFPGVK